MSRTPGVAVNPKDSGTQTVSEDDQQKHGEDTCEVIQSLQEALESAQKNLDQTNTQLKETRKRWKQTAVELNELRSRGQGFYHVTDDFLIRLAKQLRFNIQSFSIQYFQGKLGKDVKFPQKADFWNKHMTTAVEGDNTLQYYLRSQRRCPSIIQAYLWSVFKEQLFDCFLSCTAPIFRQEHPLQELDRHVRQEAEAPQAKRPKHVFGLFERTPRDRQRRLHRRLLQSMGHGERNERSAGVARKQVHPFEDAGKTRLAAESLQQHGRQQSADATAIE